MPCCRSFSAAARGVGGWQHDFDQKQADVLNRMVLFYTLPLMLFAGIAGTPRDQLAGDATLLAVIVFCLLASYVAPLLIARFIFRRDLMTSTLQALAIGGPSVAFVGLPVLGYLFGATAATIPVVISALVLVVVQIPATLILLSRGAAKRGEKRASANHSRLRHGRVQTAHAVGAPIGFRANIARRSHP